MITPTFANRHHDEKTFNPLRIALVATLVVLGSLLADRPAGAGGGGGGGGMGGGGGTAAAAAVGSAGLESCNSNSGTALYGCVANVLDRMSNDVSRRYSSQTGRALQTAASQLRAAVNKAQALSAIAQCRSVVAGVLQRLRGTGRDGGGLSAIAGVLAQAARLIQSKG